MKYGRILMSLVLGAMALGVSGRHLTPEEAYEAAKVESGSFRAPARYTAPAMTKSDADGVAMVYVFTAGKDAPGFMVLSADDNFNLLLGYSDTEVLDVTDLPPAFDWWLDLCAHNVAEAASESGVMKRARLGVATIDCDEVAETEGSDQQLRHLSARASRETIAPIMKTLWDQAAPYYNMCPKLGNSRAVTGCVATAMAQVMKVHQWPVKGTGSSSYSFKYNNKTYSLSANYGDTTYDWANMLNSYTGSSTEAQKNAVATLMYHCGVASKMNYSPDGSGTNLIEAGIGLINYLGYDKAMTHEYRSWYTSSQWDDMVYGNLAAGMPVVYAGDDGKYGHCFVADGYKDGYYHINWGWSGAANGYYLLTDLNPYEQGIGGGSGEDGFNYGQSILYNMRPAQDGSQIVPIMASVGEITPGATTYQRNATTQVEINGNFYAFGLDTFEYTVGLEVQKNGTPSYLTYGMAEIRPLYGLGQFRITANKFPVGEYDVYPAFKTSKTGWERMRYDVEEVPGCLHFSVTSTEITITQPEGPTGPTAGMVTAEAQNISPVNAADKGFYPGHSYRCVWSMTSTGAWSENVTTVVLNANATLVAYSDLQTVTFDEAGTKTDLTWQIDLPSSMSPGSYYMCLAYDKSGSLGIIKDVYSIEVENATAASGTGTVSNITFVGSSSQGKSSYNPAQLDIETPEILLDVKSTSGTWNDRLSIAFAGLSDLVIIGNTSSQPVSLAENATAQLSFKGPWSFLSADVVYAMVVWSENTGQLSNIRYVKLNQHSGLLEVVAEADVEGKVEYYDLQGRALTIDSEWDCPRQMPSGIYLRRQGTAVTKVAM